MACGGCGNRKPQPPPKSSSKSCVKCSWPTRKVNKYNIKSRKNDIMNVCVNARCKYSSS